MGKYETLFAIGVAVGGILVFLFLTEVHWGGGGAIFQRSEAPAGAAQANTAANLVAGRETGIGRRARSDLDTALAELAALDRAEQENAALEIFAAIPFEEGATARIAAALPNAARFGFTVDALTLLAERDVRAALQAATASLTTQQQAVVLPRIAAVAARTDPVAALESASAVPDPAPRQLYANAVLSAWADVDASAVLAHLESTSGAAVRGDAALFAALAASDADRLLAIVERFPPDARLAAQRAALDVLATRDPLDAFARIESVPPGRDRDRLIQTIGEAYARRDADAAIRWTASLTPRSQAALNGVVSGIAAVDVERAVDFVVRELASPSMPELDAGSALPMAALYRHMNTRKADVASIAGRLLATGNSTLRSRASGMLSRWVVDDAPAAIDWAVANAGTLDASAFAAIARNAGTVDAALASQTVARLPAERHATWIGEAAAGLAQTDVAAAEQFLARHRGQPGYTQGMQALVQSVLQTDPASAARLFAEAGGSASIPGVAPAIANGWALRDGPAAARWALERRDPTAVRAAVSGWAQRDADAARAWVLTLGAGAERDSAITGYLTGSAAASDADAQLIATYSSDAERQRNVASAAQTLSFRNAERARQLFDVYVTDPALRSQFAELLRGESPPIQAPVFPRIVQ